MVEVGLAPGYVSAISGGHVYGALNATPPGTVPSGAPFPFAGVSNVPGFTISTKAPVETAAPKTNVGVPYARNVPSVFAQEPKNLVTACAGDPVFVSNKTPMLRGDTNRFTYSCTVEYLNEKLAGQDNRIAAGAAVSAATMAVRKALLDTAHKQKLEELNDQGAAALADSKALGKTAAEQEAAKELVTEIEKKFATEVAEHKKKVENETFDESLDFFTQVPALREWKLDGVLRSIDMDGTPLIDRRTGTEVVVNTSDVSVSTLLNVIVQGPARVRIADGVGFDEKWTYASNGRGRHRVSVFDQLILALVRMTDEDGKTYYQVKRSTRSYEQERDPKTSAFTKTKTIYQGIEEGSMVGFWRLGRVLEEPNKMDRMCGVHYSGEFVLVRNGNEQIL